MDISSEVTRNVLKKVRQLEIRTNRLLDDHAAGAYRSIFKGQGIDFEEVREYIAGDDIRSIDWNITAKMNRPYIKKFREDRELTVFLVVDISASLDFGSISLSKREILTELASLLAFSASRSNHKIGLLLFSDRMEQWVSPAKGKKHVLRIIRDVLFHEPGSKRTNLMGMIAPLDHALKKRAMVFLLSDFFCPDIPTTRQLTKALAILNHRHDLICLKVGDRKESGLPRLGWVTFEDSETGEILEIDTSARSFFEKYQNEKGSSDEFFRENLKKSGIDLFEISTEGHYLQALDQFLKGRRSKR